jgi:hypothetical protein
VALADAILAFYARGGRDAYEPAVREAARRFSWGAIVDGIESLAAEAKAKATAKARRSNRSIVA